jgi:hypothetical protein
VPIALAYHLAHYFAYLFVQGQRIVPLLSDPFGRGWDLLGTTDYTPDPGIVSAGLVCLANSYYLSKSPSFHRLVNWVSSGTIGAHA